MVTALPLSPSASKVSRNAGSRRGSLSAFTPPLAHSLEQQILERVLAQGRSSDLAVNDWAAHSGINSIATCAVGTGLTPQSRIDYKRLGVSPEAARRLQSDIEAVWKDWTPQAHARGLLTYEDLQFLGLRSMLRTGEMLHLPVMLSGPGRKIRLAVQDVRPDRLRTPLDKRHDPSIVDGVQLDAHGTPVAYWLSTPGPALSRVPGMSGLASDQFTRVPARVGHRPGIFHLFRHNEEEQVRGESVLNPGMNLFRHLADALDNELLAAVTQAALAVFISRDTSGTALPGYVHEADDSDGGKGEHYHEAVLAGTVMYGNENEKPHMLETSRPSPNFAVFCEFVLRAMAASLEIPYIVLCKDFSKVNYSSARAALIEAWRVYLFWRSMMVSHYCRPIWSMVIEEAWLAGHLRLPAGAPDFYDAVSLYTRAIWIGPSRGYVEPKKEIEATVLALGNRLMTYSEAIAERGRDFDDVMDEREEEEARLAKLPQPPMQQSGKKPAAPDAPEEGEDSDASE